MSIPSVIGKYEVTRQLAQGGMGTLYLAHDPVLDRLVAIKVIRGDFQDPALRERFVQEAQSVSRLRHPNIVTIFEYGEFDGQPFIAMEYITGDSVGDLIRRHEPLPLARKLQIMEEICAGMACAHRAKVVHRDLKPDNIMVDAEGALVKVVDFGIARSLHTNATRFTQGIGTPNYMAPEVFMGQMDYRSDIYAIGAVCYELLSYQKAFDGDMAFAVIGKIVLEKPAPLADICPGVDPAIVEVVNKALEKEPAQRYQDLDEMRADIKRVAASLAAGDTASSSPQIGEARGAAGAVARRPSRRWWAWAAAVVAAVMIGFGLGARDWLRSSPPMAPSAGSSTKIRRSVAVLGFKNLSGRADAAWLSTALAEMLTTELSAGERLRAIPGENVARMKIELTLSDADSFAGDTLKRIGQNIGTDVVLVGSYMNIGVPGSEKIRLDLRLQDTATGDTIAVVSDTAPETELLDLMTRTGARLRDRLGVGELSSGEVASVQASLPSTPEATRLYAEGLRKLRVYDNLAARTYFERALVADPSSPLIYAGLAAAWSKLGYDAQAAAAASKAFEQSGKLSRADRLSIEGQVREIRHEWDQAIRVYHSLIDFFPDNVEYGLRLAAALDSAGRGKDALATLDALRALAGAESDPRIDVAESGVATSLSDFKRALAAALRAGAKAEEQGAQLLVAQARLQEGIALISLGDLAKAPRALEEGKAIFVAAGDRAAAARASNLIAQVLARRGDLDAARRLLEETLTIYLEIGNVGGVALIQSGLSNVHNVRGELDEAVKAAERALQVYRQLNHKEGIARTQNNIGDALRQAGNKAGATERFEEALAIWREIGRRRDSAVALDNLAALRYDIGDLAGARRLAEEALVISREAGDKSELGYGLRNLANIMRAQGDLAGARGRQEQAVALQEQSTARTAAALSRQDLAKTALEQGRLAEAEMLARGAAEDFRNQRLPSDEAATEALLAELFLLQGKLDDARAAIRQATDLIRNSKNRRDSLYVRIVAARVSAASGRPAEAERILQAALAEAQQMHIMDRELESRLALSVIELTSGQPAAGQRRLVALRQQATDKGFGLIARKAAMAQPTSP